MPPSPHSHCPQHCHLATAAHPAVTCCHCHPPHSTACAQPCAPLPGAVHPLCHLLPQSRLHSPHCHLLGDMACTALCHHPLHPVPLGHSLCVRPCHPLSLVPPPQGTGSEHPAVTSHAGAQAGYTPLSPPPAAHPRCLWLHSQPLLFSPHFCGPKHPTVLSLPAINPSRGTDVPGATAPSCLAPGALSILTNAPAQ